MVIGVGLLRSCSVPLSEAQYKGPKMVDGALWGYVIGIMA